MSDLGMQACCACREVKPCRNIVMLPVHAPIPGTGWGCFVCKLPPNGASAIVCDECLASGREIVDVLYGYVSEGTRFSRAACTEPFDHDEAAHTAFEAAH